jgi:uncharacterized protein YhbP (UPF0306 family)
MPAKGEELKMEVLEYLNRHNTMTLATAHDNAPWAATVFYANDGFTLYFISSPNACLHCQNIARNPHVAITIDEDYSLENPNDWRKVKGVQMEGVAEMLTADEEISRAVKVYARKYPFTALYLKAMFSVPGVMSFLNKLADKLKFIPDFTASSENKFYKVTPTRIWFVDNETSFEKRQEVIF